MEGRLGTELRAWRRKGGAAVRRERGRGEVLQVGGGVIDVYGCRCGYGVTGRTKG